MHTLFLQYVDTTIEDDVQSDLVTAARETIATTKLGTPQSQ